MPGHDICVVYLRRLHSLSLTFSLFLCSDLLCVLCFQPEPNHSNELSYFEVTVRSAGEAGMIAIGFGQQGTSDKFPGASDKSFGYLANNGEIHSGPFVQSWAAFGAGSVIGCGYDVKKRKIFYTRDGRFLGYAFTQVKPQRYVAMISMQTKGEEVSVNFGANPFEYKSVQTNCCPRQDVILVPVATSPAFTVGLTAKCINTGAPAICTSSAVLVKEDAVSCSS